MNATWNRTLPLFGVFMLSVVPNVIGQPVPIQPMPIDLGTLGATISVPTGLNERGDVVGRIRLLTLTGDDFVHGFVWTATTGMVDLGTLSGETSAASGVNNTGQVVGTSSTTGNTALRAFVWTAAQGMRDLGALGGHDTDASEANAVNDYGQVVGSSDPEPKFVDGFPVSHAFMWTTAEGMVDLGTFGGETETVGVNNSGHVIGWSRYPRGLIHAFRWTAATGMVDLGTLGGRTSLAAAVNDDGWVVGDSQTDPQDNGIYHAFLWTPTGGMVDLGTLSGHSISSAAAVNDDGWVVGHSQPDPRQNTNLIGHAFVWTPTEGMVDLGEGAASDVNNHGWVVGRSGSSGFVWTASGGMVELPPLPGYASSRAMFVNNSGHIVGVSHQAAPHDLSTERATMWVLPAPGDFTPPTILLPPTIVVDGTSPAGAAVMYSVSATDDTDPNPVVVCTPPSGSVFPLLATAVTCTATDAAGNSASGTFNVVVKDASQQLADAISLIGSWNLPPPGASLITRLEIATRFTTGRGAVQACGIMNGFLQQVQAQRGKALSEDQATELTMRGNRIRNLIGC